MNSFQKLLTFLWNSLFFSHREIEENQRRRFKENNPEFKEETKKKTGKRKNEIMPDNVPTIHCRIR